MSNKPRNEERSLSNHWPHLIKLNLSIRVKNLLQLQFLSCRRHYLKLPNFFCCKFNRL